MKRAIIAATAAAGIGITQGACGGLGSSSAERQSSRQSSGGGVVTGTWTIVSCQVDVTYIDDTTTTDDYVPDTDANFQQRFAPSQASGATGISAVITFVNNTGAPASLPTGLVVSFTDESGNLVGKPQSFDGPYGSAVTNGHGSGETFSSSTLFNPGQTVAEAPDLGNSVPRQPDLSCSVRQR